jgi:hypothetical protein
VFDGLRIQNAARAASYATGETYKPAPSNCGKSSIASLALRPRFDLPFAPGSIDLEVGIWGQPASPHHSWGQRRFPVSVGKFASACVQPRFHSEVNPDRPRQSAFPATVRSSRFPTYSSHQARLPRKRRQCISKSSRCPLRYEADYEVEMASTQAQHFAILLPKCAGAVLRL